MRPLARIDAAVEGHLRYELEISDYTTAVHNAKGIDVKKALLQSKTRKSLVPFDPAPARITNSASEVRKGLQTVEMIRATSVQTRLRTRNATGGTSGSCTRTGLRPAASNIRE